MLDIPEEDRAPCLVRLKSQLGIVQSVNDEAAASGTLLKLGISRADDRYKDPAHYDIEYFKPGRQVLKGEKEQRGTLLLEQVALLYSQCHLLNGVNENDRAAHPKTSTDSETVYNLRVVPVRKDIGVEDYEFYCDVHVSYYYKRMSHTEEEAGANGRKVQVLADRKSQVSADRKSQVPADRKPNSRKASAASFAKMVATKKPAANGQAPTITCPCCPKKRASLANLQGHFRKEHNAWYKQNWQLQRPLLKKQCTENKVKLT